VQVVAIAAYLGRSTQAAGVARQGVQLIDSQVRADGSQPQELQRTNSWDYSAMKLRRCAHWRPRRIW